VNGRNSSGDNEKKMFLLCSLACICFEVIDGSPEAPHYIVLEESKSRDGSPKAPDHKVIVEERKSNKVEPVSEGEIFCFVSQKKKK
jgi:hypothetical protein